MQTKEEIVKTWYPNAKIIYHPYGGAILIAFPDSDSNSHHWLTSKCFPLNTDPELLWEDAYWHMIERAKILLEFSQSYRSLFQD